MRYLLLPFVIYFFLHSVGEVRGRQKEKCPQWIVAAEYIAQTALILGILLYIVNLLPSMLQPAWLFIAAPAATMEFMLRALTSRANEGETTAAGKWLDRAILLPLVALISGPAAYFTLRAGAEPRLAFMLLFASACVGTLVGVIIPPPQVLKTPKHQKELIQWLKEGKSFGRSPDEITLLDLRSQFWPGLDTVECALFRVRYDSNWYIALASPLCHCFAKPTRPDYPIDKAYEAYKEWFANQAGNAMITQAAKKMPIDFQRLVGESLPPEHDPELE